MSEELKKIAWQHIDDNQNTFRDLALDILNHPEIGYEETRASTKLTELLEGFGFEVQQPLADLQTAFKAKMSNHQGPAVFFLAEYDALPGVGHGCGHNLIGPAAAAAAVGVAAVLKDLRGTVGVIGTPAEEYLGVEEGKIKLLRAGVFDDVSVALMMHPYYRTQVMEGDLGFIACEFEYFGEAAHASADPWEGKNALDGLLAAYQQINALRQHVQPDVRIHGVITAGGEAPNIIPAYAAAQFMVRAAHPEILEQVYERVCDCARAGALSSGTRLKINRITTVFNSRINHTLNQMIIENFESLGSAVDPEPYQMAASSDFGNVSQEIPSAMFMINSHPAGIPWHSEQVVEGSGQDKALRAMLESACVLAGVALDLLSDKAALEKVQKEFNNNG